MNVAKIKSFLNGAILPVIFVVVAVVLLSLANAAHVSASRYSEGDNQQKVKMYLYGLLVASCYQAEGVTSSSWHVETDATKVSNGQLFYSEGGNAQPIVYSVSNTITGEVAGFGDDYWTGCGHEDGDLTKKALSAWGISALDLVCQMGYVRDGDGASCKQSTDKNFKSNGGIDDKAMRASKFKSALKTLVGLDVDNPGSQILYLRWREVVVNACTTGVGVPENEATVSGDLRYDLKEIEGSKIITNVYSGGNKKSEKPHNTSISYTCGDALTNANLYVEDYYNETLEDVAQQQCKELGYTNSAPYVVDLTACVWGATHKTGDCISAYPDAAINGNGVSTTVDRKSAREACIVGQGLTLDPSAVVAGDTADDDQSTATTCAVEAIGWIICPVVKFLAFIADASFDFLSNSFLEVKADTFNTSGQAYQVWSWMRNIANVMFVIAFMIIIFSQLTGMGVTNYGVKKMLPRIIIAAILVNISYFISQLAVDLSNILGYGIRQVFDAATKSIGGQQNIVSGFTDGGGLAGIAGGVLAGAAAGVALYAMLSTLIPVLLAAVLALVMILFMLVARQAIVILLVVLSPIAFVAFLLPNTERLFKMWRQMLTAMLLLFPIISLIFRASVLASGILTSTFASSSTIDGVDGNIVGQIMGAAILVIPLFAVPIVLKKSLDGIPVLGQMANRLSGRANANVSKKARESYGESRFAAGRNFRKANRATNRALARGGKYEGNNPFLQARSAISGSLNRRSGEFGEKLTAQAIGLANKEDAESITLAEQKIRRESLANPNAARKTLDAALRSGDKVAARAAQNVLFSQGASGMKSFYESVTEAQASGQAHSGAVDSLRENINTNHGQMVKQKAKDISTWAATGGVNGNLAATSADAKTWQGLSQADMSTQTGASLQRAQQHLDKEVATELLKNKNLVGNLDDDQRSALGVASKRGDAPTPAPVPETRATQREFSREQYTAMGADNTQNIVDSRGIENLSDGDIISIANAHGSASVGQSARQEAVSRGLIQQQTQRPTNTMPQQPPTNGPPTP